MDDDKIDQMTDEVANRALEEASRRARWLKRKAAFLALNGAERLLLDMGIDPESGDWTTLENAYEVAFYLRVADEMQGMADEVASE